MLKKTVDFLRQGEGLELNCDLLLLFFPLIFVNFVSYSTKKFVGNKQPFMWGEVNNNDMMKTDMFWKTQCFVRKC